MKKHFFLSGFLSRSFGRSLSLAHSLVLVLLSLALTACTRGKDTLQFNLVSEAVQLDWNRATDSSSIIVLDNLMEGLTSYAEALRSSTGEQPRPMPALAASWAVLDGGTRYRFHLRQGVRWSDGVPLEAKHFVDSWHRLLDPQTKSEASYHLYDIVGAREYGEGSAKNFSTVGITAVDAATLEVKLKRPAPYFLHLVATVNTFPIRQDLIDKYGANWTNLEHLVTLGPYSLKTFSPGDSLTLTSNGTYWGEKALIQNVRCKMVSEPVTALALYENKELDILPRDLPASYISFWQKHSDYLTGPQLSVSYLVFNTHRAPFNSVEARREFAQSIQRERLANFLRGSHSPTSAWIPPGMSAYTKDVGLHFEAGKRKFPRGKEIRIRYSGNDNWNLVFQTLQKMLKENAGLQVRLDPIDWKEYRAFLSQSGNKALWNSPESPQVLHLGWAADYPDAHSFMNVFSSASDSSYTGGWKSARYDALIERAVSTENEEARKALYTAAQKILLEEEVVIVPLFYASHQALVKPWIRGVTLNSLDKWYFKNLRFEFAQ